MEKVLRINVGAENGPVATIEELGAYAGLGGRAMTTTVVCNEVPPNCHPLGPENKLVFSPGLMAGSAGTRICDHRDCRGNAHVQFHHLLYRS